MRHGVRVSAVACALALAIAAAASCYGPTSVDVALSTDLSCSEWIAEPRARIFLGAGSGGAGVARSDECTAVGNVSELGNLVVVPSGARDARFVLTVALATGKDPDACLPPGSAEGCIIARRSVSFVEHRARRLAVRLYRDCFGVSCDPTRSCWRGECIPLDRFCDEADGCFPAAAPTPDGAPPDAAPPPVDSGLDGFDAGTPTPIASGRTFIGSLAVDATGVYFTELGEYASANGAVYRAGPDPTQPALLAGARELPGAITLDGTFAYWIELLGAGIVGVPKAGGPLSTVVPSTGVGVNATVILASGTALYWNNEAVGLTPGAIRRKEVGGVAGSLVQGIADGPWAMAQDGASLVWMSGPRFGGPGKVWTTTTTGGAATTATADTDTSALSARVAAAGGNVAWSSTAVGGSVVVKTPVSTVPLTIATGQGTVSAIAADATALYWVHPVGGGHALEKSTWNGAVRTLRTGIETPGPIALDTTYVYFVDEHDSTSTRATAEIARLPK